MRKFLFLFLSLVLATMASAQAPATFDDVQLGSNGIWTGPEGENELPSGGWIFTNSSYPSWGFWGGFTVSNRTDLNQTGLNAQYTAVTGCGYDGSSQYAVAYTYGVQTDVYAADGQSHTITGCYITNNLWAYQHVLYGESGVTPFGGLSGDDPDWFKLTATGKNASGQTIAELDFYLADYRFANNEDDYVLDTWEWFDLSPLGSVASISFSLSSTKSNYGGMITPAYFCMEDFNGVAPGGVDLPPYIANPVSDVVFNEYPQTIQVNLDGVATDPDDPDENIVYTIVNNSNPSALTATMNGKILVMTRQNANQATADLTMRATSDGQYVDFNVHVIINVVVDEPPYIVNPVQDVVFNEYPQTIQANLDGVATDPDDPDENIVYTIVNNSNPSALTATMNGKILVMTRQNANQATANLTMRATSDGQHVDFNVHVIINVVVDEPPYIVNPVQDVVFNEYPQTIQVNLNGVATDPDDPDENIVYTIVNNSNPSALTATMNGKILVMTRQNANQATADLTMRATSDGQYVNFNVHVIINAVVDEPPYIINPVDEVGFDAFPQTVEVDLEGVATDPDDPDEDIVYSIVSNPNPEALTATINGRILELVRETEGDADFDLVMRATSDGQYVDFNIHVIIKQMESIGENAISFMVYPNPTSDVLTLAVANAQGFDYEVYNLVGQVVMKGDVVGQKAILNWVIVPKVCISSLSFVMAIA